MKRLAVLCLVFVLFTVTKAFCGELDFSTDKQLQTVINQTGFKILNANGTEHRMIFKIEKSNSLNGRIDSKQKIVYIPTEILTRTETEDETAAVITRQIVRCIRTYEEKRADYTEKISPRKYETYTDKRTVDYLVKAGYSPIALITMINKTYGVEKKSLFAKHNDASSRMARIYEYIARKYPQKLEDKNLKNNVYYQNFLLNSRYNRSLLQNRMKHNPYSSEQIEYR